MKPVIALTRTRRVLAGLVLAVMSTAWASSVAWAADADFSPQNLADYERRALVNHPELEAEQQKLRAIQAEGERHLASYPQPTLSYGAEIGTPWTAKPGLGHTVMLTQQFLLPGRRAAWAKPATLRGSGAEAQMEASSNQIVFEVRQALIEVARLDHHLLIFNKQKEVYSEALSMVEALMSTGRTSYADVLRLSVTSEMLTDQVDTVQRERDEVVAGLRVELGLKPDSKMRFDFSGENDPTAVSQDALDLEALLELMNAQNPELRALEFEAQAEIAQIEVAQNERWQGPTVGVGYMNMPSMMMQEDDREDALMLSVAMPIPIFGRQISLNSERFEATSLSARAQQAALRRALSQEVESSVLKIRERQKRLQRYEKELIPMLGDVSERLLADVEVGRAQVTDFQLVFQQQLDLEMMLVDLRADIAIEQARLRMLTGEALE